MKDRLGILRCLVRRYERTKAGRTGEAKAALSLDYEALLAEAGCATGGPRVAAEAELAQAEQLGVLRRVPHPSDPKLFQRLRFNAGAEAKLYALLEEPSPRERREALAEHFAGAAHGQVPDRWQADWQKWCAQLEQAARSGGSVAPFDRQDSAGTAEMLSLLRHLLSWRGESLVRFASCVLGGDLLIQTSYPGSATRALIARLPAEMEFWHFGDTDPPGYDILRELREATGPGFQCLHMCFRPALGAPPLTEDERRQLVRLLGLPILEPERTTLRTMLEANTKGNFEQETYGPPTLKCWPY